MGLFTGFDCVETVLTQPVLIVAGMEAASLLHGTELYAKAAGSKELAPIDGATHMDFHDGPVVERAMAKLSPFFARTLQIGQLRSSRMTKVWLVTGANSGIGAGVTKSALRAGHKVIASGRSMDKLRGAFADENQVNLALVRLDLTDESQVLAAIAEAVQRFGWIDVLVNKAGNSVLGNFEDFSVADIKKQLGTNFFSVVHVMQATLLAMRKQRAGHVFNISSVAGGVGLKHCSAVEGLSMAVAAEVERFGIKRVSLSQASSARAS